MAVDKAALVACKEEDGLCLFDSLTKPAAGEVNLATMALGLVVTEPVLQERRTIKVNTSQ